jgi:hypothetical protein
MAARGALRAGGAEGEEGRQRGQRREQREGDTCWDLGLSEGRHFLHVGTVTPAT